MVSTRHSLEPGAALVALDMSGSSGRARRSPSPKKRKAASEETPEQSFVDARETPFVLRRHSSSEDGMETPTQSRRRLQRPQHAKVEGGGSEDDSDDEAPEAMTNSATARIARELESVRREELKRRAEVSRERRRKKDEILRLQKQASRPAQSVPAAEPLEDGREDSEKSKRVVIPRLLPEELLNGPEAFSSSQSSAQEPQRVSTHIKFEPRKEVTKVKKGPLLVQLLKKQRRDLAPRQSASTVNTKNQWLYGRGQHSVDRRRIKKPLT